MPTLYTTLQDLKIAPSHSPAWSEEEDSVARIVRLLFLNLLVKPI